MTHVTVSVIVEREPEEVFDFISNPANNPLWQGGMVSCQVTSDGPLGVGSTYLQKAKFLGRDVVSKFEIVVYEPGRRIKGQTIESTFPITFDRRVEPAEGGSRVTAVVTGDASGIFRLFFPLLNWMVQRSIQKDYSRLKKLLKSE